MRIRRSVTTGFYYIRPNRGAIAERIKGSWSSYKKAEAVLIKYLKSRERVLAKAVFPEELR